MGLPVTSAIKALRDEFANAARLRAERRKLVETLRQLLMHRTTLEPPLLIMPDRRRTPRDA
jgi:hypothetical protein